MRKSLSRLALFVLIPLLAIAGEIKREQVKVSRVIDGDTVELEDKRHLRLANINAPEKNAIGYDASFLYSKKLEGKTVQIEVLGMDRDSRFVARIYDEKGCTNYFNLAIVREGYASKFFVQESELRDFSRAERQAVEQERGIWKKSEYFGMFNVDIDAKSETVILSARNSLVSSPNLEDWILKDESQEFFKFPRTDIKTIGRIIKVYSGKKAKELIQSRTTKTTSTNEFI